MKDKIERGYMPIICCFNCAYLAFLKHEICLIHLSVHWNLLTTPSEMHT